MNLLGEAFNLILYKPFLNALILIYNFLGKDIGIAVVLLTLLIKLILFPVSAKTIRSQKKAAELQEKIKEIQRNCGKDKEKQNRAIMELYQKEKINPFSGCLPLFLQLPILIALYKVFLTGLDLKILSVSLYSFVSLPESVNYHFLGAINLATPNIIIAFLSGFLQYVQAKLSISFISPSAGKKENFSTAMQKQMTFLFPVFTVFIVWKMGALIGVYWIISTLFSIIENFIIKKMNKNEIYGEKREISQKNN